jgi:hypothetical protein
MGWGTVSLAVLFTDLRQWGWRPGLPGTLASIATVLLVLSVAIATWGLKSIGGWKWPSEKDWFHQEFFPWPLRLKRQHLIVMLEAHQSYSMKTQRKGVALMLSEWALIGAAVLLGSSVIAKQMG